MGNRHRRTDHRHVRSRRLVALQHGIEIDRGEDVAVHHEQVALHVGRDFPQGTGRPQRLLLPDVADVPPEPRDRRADRQVEVRGVADAIVADLRNADLLGAVLRQGFGGLDPAEMVALDRWAVGQAHRLQQEIIAAYEAYNFHLIYQKLLNFCVADMGGFYLDVIKDRQYTTKADSLPRRSCQTAMFHIVEAMVRWMAPVLSFTADEIWGFMPGERTESVFMETWYEGLYAADDGPLDNAGWARLITVKTAVAKQLEAMRKDFVANVSHELRTPLASMQGYVDTLIIKNGSLSADQRDHYLNITRKHAHRLGRLIGDLFELSRLDSASVEPQFERFSVAELLQDTSQEFELEASRAGVRLDVAAPRDGASVVADIGLIQRVLENLIRNALRFTPSGGRITLSVEERSSKLAVAVADQADCRCRYTLPAPTA